VLPSLKAADRASVVLFSTVAVGTGMPMHASIAAAKGAVEGLTRSLAAELAPGIRVNAIAPSLTDTPLAAGLLRSERQRAAAAERHPLGRIGQPSDLAATARFLLSEEAGWVTGQVLNVDGGMGALRRFG
jgi:NAD(P)-dependent dehydrogenase (short-subunit alcohol dehydrogenase family)